MKVKPQPNKKAVNVRQAKVASRSAKPKSLKKGIRSRQGIAADPIPKEAPTAKSTARAKNAKATAASAQGKSAGVGKKAVKQTTKKKAVRKAVPGNIKRSTRPPKKKAAKKSAPAVPRETKPDQLDLSLGGEIAPGEVVDSRLLLPQKLCAVVFNVSAQAIQQWNVKPRVRHGREQLYYLPDLSFYRDQQRDIKTESNLTFERTRVARAQANRTEHEVDQMTGNLIPVEEVLAAWEPIITAARAKILSIPSKLKGAIPKLTDADIAKAKKISREILQDLAAKK